MRVSVKLWKLRLRFEAGWTPKSKVRSDEKIPMPDIYVDEAGEWHVYPHGMLYKWG